MVFGRCYISNPDLAFKLKNNIGLTKYNRATFYKHNQRKAIPNTLSVKSTRL
jgi:hypothetical protein